MRDVTLTVYRFDELLQISQERIVKEHGELYYNSLDLEPIFIDTLMHELGFTPRLTHSIGDYELDYVNLSGSIKRHYHLFHKILQDYPETRKAYRDYGLTPFKVVNKVSSAFSDASAVSFCGDNDSFFELKDRIQTEIDNLASSDADSDDFKQEQLDSEDLSLLLTQLEEQNKQIECRLAEKLYETACSLEKLGLAEIAHVQSADYVKEMCELNEYEFMANGDPFKRGSYTQRVIKDTE